ncbi:MAG: S8 family serine peptidase [Truepera sp.]|nr:S8 family serine peptidase [Truepera sp.]
MKRALLGLVLVLFLIACSTPPPQNQAPTASFTATSVEGTTFVFNAAGSSDPDGAIIAYSWSFGDGGPATGVTVNHTYTNHGNFTVSLTVTDNQRATDTTTRTIPIGRLSGAIGVGTAASGEGTPIPAQGAAVTEAPFVPGEVIVQFAPGISTMSALNVAGAGLQLVRPLALPNAALYRIADAVALQATEAGRAATIALIDQLNARPDVVEAQPNYILTAMRTPNDQFYPRQWHYPAINLPQAWDLTTGSAATVVAVIDTGILFEAGNSSRIHPDFVGRVLPGYDFISNPTTANDGDGRDPNPYDDGDNPTLGGQSSYHGSHVAGTIAAATNTNVGVAGVDWQARILPVRVLGVDGGTFVDILDGLLWSVGRSVSGVPNNLNPAGIVNMSLGGQFSCTTTMQSAIDQALATGAIIVVAAGNSNTNAANFAPASCAGVITVGATEFQGSRAPYSNFGSRIDVMAPGGDVTADRNNDGWPDGVLSLWRNDTTNQFDYTFMQGTSQAAPHVAGVIALMKSLKPTLTSAEALNILKGTARPLLAVECNRPSGGECGAGLIDAYAALQALNNPPPPPTGGELSFTPALLDFGTTTVELDVTLTNVGGESLTWAISYFQPAPDNPGSIPEGTVYVPSGFPLSGTLAAGASTVTRIGIDRSFITTDGFYQLELVLLENGTTERRLPVRFTKAPATQPDPTGPTIVAGFIEQTPGIFTVSGYEERGSYFTSYTFPALAGATWVVAWVDVNNNGLVDGGDYEGFYPTQVALAGNQVLSDLNIAMEPVVDVPALLAQYGEIVRLLEARRASQGLAR